MERDRKICLAFWEFSKGLFDFSGHFRHFSPIVLGENGSATQTGNGISLHKSALASEFKGAIAPPITWSVLAEFHRRNIPTIMTVEYGGYGVISLGLTERDAISDDTAVLVGQIFGIPIVGDLVVKMDTPTVITLCVESERSYLWVQGLHYSAKSYVSHSPQETVADRFWLVADGDDGCATYYLSTVMAESFDDEAALRHAAFLLKRLWWANPPCGRFFA